MPTSAPSPAKNTKTPVKLPATSPKPNNMPSQCGSERRWKCSLPTSNAFSGWADSDYAARTVQKTNSYSLQPPKTFANSPRSFLHRSKCKKPVRRGAREMNSTILSAPATRCFSTESARNGHQPTSDHAASYSMPPTSKYMHGACLVNT